MLKLGRLQLYRRLPQRPWVQAKRTLLTQSYAQGPTSPPLLQHTIPEHFDEIVSEHGARTAVVSRHQRQRLTYSELQAQSNALAWGLRDIGVKKGDRVAVYMGNCMEYAIVTYSIYRLGAILVPLNPAFTTLQVVSALNHLEASHLIIGSETHLSYKPPRSNLPLLQDLIHDHNSRTLHSTAVPSLRQIIVADTHTSTSTSQASLSTLKPLLPFSSLLASTEPTSTPNPISPPPLAHPLKRTEVINIQFTSGTTSAPKAASLSHTSILNNVSSIGRGLRLTSKDVIICPPPLFHCFGSVLGYMASVSSGASIVFPSPAFDAEATLKAVDEEQGSALYGVPTMFLPVLDLLSSGAVEKGGREMGKGKGKGMGRLRTGIAAGSSIPAELMRRLHREMGLRELCICYGMTETSPVSCMTSTDDTVEKRVESVGKAMPHVTVKIVDAHNRGRVVGIGEKGELAVAGYLVMRGYWGDEARTNDVIETDAEGKRWMYTGDEAVMDGEGYVRITGRLKDLIIRGGENVQPLEVENCLLGCARVRDVAVVGVRDERYGEVVGAFVVRRDSGGGEEGKGMLEEEDVRKWVGERMSRHLVPKYVFFVEGFPKTASGKVQKFMLRAEAERLVYGKESNE